MAPSVQEYVNKEELRMLYRINRWSTVRASLFTWACIVASLWAWSAVPRWPVFVAAFFVIATRQHALNNLVHEAAHYSISRNRAVNDWVSDFFYAAPHLISTDGYRQKHLLHHSDLGDPAVDSEIKPRYLIRGSAFVKQTLLAMCGYAALEAARAYRPTLQAKTRRGRHLGLVIFTNTLLFAYCGWLGVPFAYLTLWLLPLFTLTMYIGTLRVIAEHQPLDYAVTGVTDVSEKMPAFTRSIAAGAIERFIFGPVNFCYHNEHHLAPGIPFANLPVLNQLLRARGFYRDGDDRFAESYIGVLTRLTFPRISSAGADVTPDPEGAGR